MTDNLIARLRKLAARTWEIPWDTCEDVIAAANALEHVSLRAHVAEQDAKEDHKHDPKCERVTHPNSLHPCNCGLAAREDR